MTEVQRPVDIEVSKDVTSEIKVEVSPVDSEQTCDSGLGTSEPSPVSDDPPVTLNGISNPGLDDASVDQVKMANGTVTNGPDEIAPSGDLWTVQRDGAVKIRMGDGVLSEKPVSVPSMFQTAVKQFKNNVALGWKSDKNAEWKTWTYQQYYDDVIKAAKAFIKLGLEQYNAVGIVGFNSPEWFIADIGAIFAGGLACGIYTTNTPEACQYVAENAKCNVIVVENDAQLQKILKVREQLPDLKAIVQYRGELKEKYPDCYTWSEFMGMGSDVSEETLQERIRQQAPNKCCTLIYTSGTTGNPKGVMLSHDNITWTARMVGKAAQLNPGHDSLISYLPLSHIAAQLVDVYGPIMYGASVYFAQADALKGSIGKTLQEVRPTVFLGVPRVWEKIQEKMVDAGRNSSNMRKKIAAWARGVGLKGNYSIMNGGQTPFGWTIASKLVFKKVRTLLGLDRCRIAISAAAPITKETLEFFLSLNIPVTEIYGMSESTGPHTVSFPWKYRLGSVGTEMPGATTKLSNPDAEGNGEICMQGRHVFMGYLNEEAKTRETMDDEGFLCSGDVGRKDDLGFLHITGRIKELIITAGGENVAPVPIEDTVKAELPVVSNCMLIGDKKKFLSMLITLKSEVDPDTQEPLDKLAPVTLEWLQSLDSSATTVSEVISSRDEKILASIQAGIDRANNQSTSRAQKVQKWSILPRDFTVTGGELGPTLKLRRPIVNKMYTNTIDSLYSE